MNRILIAVTALGFILGAGNSSAEVYKWVDKDGKVHYSQTKPTQSRKTEEISRTMRSGDSSTRSYAEKVKKERPIRDLISEEMTSINQNLAALNKAYQAAYNQLSDSRRALVTEKDAEKKQALETRIVAMEQEQKTLEIRRIHALRKLEALGRLRKKTGKDERTDHLARQEFNQIVSK